MIKNKIQVTKLHKEFDKLQNKYGDKTLNSVYGAGCIKKPKICFVFMNPTARNIATDKNWKGLKAQWLGTKQVWGVLNRIDLFNDILLEEIRNKKAVDWDDGFCKKVYKEICDKNIYITNLAKCSQSDARPLSDSVFEKYLDLLKKEIEIINPDIVISFGNQVSSIILDEKICVSKCRKQKFTLVVGKKEIDIYPVYYPVGQGMRNIKKVLEDLKFILDNKL